MLVVFLFLVMGTTQGSYEGCDTKIQLEMNSRREIRSKNFPLPDPPGTACHWSVHAPENTRIYLACTSLKQDVCNGLFTVKRFDQPKVYCNDKPFNAISTDNQMALIYNVNATSTTSGDIFICSFNVQNVSFANACNFCGIRKTSRITGGKTTGVTEYPMMAGLVKDGDFQRLFCGATIISSKYSLTAAICVIKRRPKHISLLIGEHDLSKIDESQTDVVGIDKIIIHKHFKREADLGITTNDIALVRIVIALRFAQNFGPACLPAPGDFNKYTKVISLGWGRAHHNPIQTLQQMSGDVQTDSTCKKTFEELNYTTTESHLCVNNVENGLCSGDWGGPILWEDENSRKLKIVGIITSDKGCTILNGQPSIHTNVTNFLSWIKENTAGESYCDEQSLDSIA